MFRGWDNVFMLLGTASGGLIGLVFIVITLTAGYDRDRAMRGASRYMTPTLVQFAVVLVISAISLAPLDAGLQRGALALLALAALIFTLADTLRMFLAGGDGVVHWSDPWCYAVAPAISYVLVGVAAMAGWALGLGALALVILMCGIRNAWDLITWLAPRGPGPGATPPPG